MKKWTLTKILSLMFLLCLWLGVCVACTDKNQEYYGIYKDGITTIEITKDYVSVDGEKRNYTVEGDTLSIEGYMGDLHFYENKKVLSFDVIVEFDSGSITERNKNFNANLWNWDTGYGIGEAYTFDSNGKITYLNTKNTMLNASGIYRIKNGVIQIFTVSVLRKENTMYWYISEQGELHFTGVYIKDLDTYFDDNNGNTDNENSSTQTPTVEFYEVIFDYAYEQKEDTVKIQEGSSIQLKTPEREGYTFNGWLINGETKNGGDIITVTQNITACAQWTENRYTITYNSNGGQLPSDGVMNSYAIYNLPYTLPIPQGTDAQSFVKWTTDEAGENEIKTITELGNYTLYAHYEDSTKFLTYKYSEVLQGYEVSDYTGNGKSVKIPSTHKGVAVKGIGNRAFYACSNLTSIEIPDGVTSIGSYAFYHCSNLTSVVIPDSVTSIDDYAFCFENNSSLTKVSYTGTIDGWAQISFGDRANPLLYAKKLYINDVLVTEATLTTATKISSYAFQGCDSLTSIEIPNSVTSIGYAAFQGCSNLTSVEIPDSVTSIGGSAFQGCSNLTSVEIPDSVTSISYGTFRNCSSLTSVVIPDSVTSIDDYAFANCNNLKTWFIHSSAVANSSGLGESITYATDVYLRTDITVTASIYNVLFNNLGKETLDGVEYYHYQIKGE